MIECSRKAMIECIRFKSYQKGHLQGFADLYIPKWGVEICGCSMYMKDGNRWLNLPSNEYTNNEGEKKFAPFLRFKEKKHWELFMKEAKKAVDEWCAANAQKEEQPFDDSAAPDEELPF